MVSLVALFGASGCETVPPHEPGKPVREGLATEAGGISYNVFITRQLNVEDAEDRDYFGGEPAPPGAALYGVFLQACNEGREPKMAASSFKIVDIQGNEFKPADQPPTSVVAYKPRELAPGTCIPDETSVAASAPSAGAMLLFELPLPILENRPLELEILPPYDLHAREQHEVKIELDL